MKLKQFFFENFAEQIYFHFQRKIEENTLEKFSQEKIIRKFFEDIKKRDSRFSAGFLSGNFFLDHFEFYGYHQRGKEKQRRLINDFYLPQKRVPKVSNFMYINTIFSFYCILQIQ